MKHISIGKVCDLLGINLSTTYRWINLCKFNHIQVIILEDKSFSFEEELTHNVIELMTVFCAKLYGKRSHKNKSKLT